MSIGWLLTVHRADIQISASRDPGLYALCCFSFNTFRAGSNVGSKSDRGGRIIKKYNSGTFGPERGQCEARASEQLESQKRNVRELKQETQRYHKASGQLMVVVSATILK